MGKVVISKGHNREPKAMWRPIPLNRAELCINTTLRCGQSFRWRKSGPDEWSCALRGRILSLKQEPGVLHYRAVFASSASSSRERTPLTPPPSSPSSSISSHAPLVDDTYAFLRHYLNLEPDLTKLYAKWSAADPNFRQRAPDFQGIRILKQDPWEALCGFICSSNNNISRISQMMHKLCLHYGPLIACLEHRVIQADDNVPGRDGNQQSIKAELTELVPYHDFPPPEALARPGVEAHLRELGFGYRAKYIYQTACIVVNEKGGLPWLESMVNPESMSLGSGRCEGDDEMPAAGRQGYREAHEALLELQGVGPKVADCICLMGLGWLEAVPVDTHVWQIAQRDYHFRTKGGGKTGVSSLTKATYDAVGNKFRAIFGKEAGWSHSILFTADLRSFSSEKAAGDRAVDKHQVNFKVKQEDDSEAANQVAIKDTKKNAPRSKRQLSEAATKLTHVELYEHEPVFQGLDMASVVKRRRRA